MHFFVVLSVLGLSENRAVFLLGRKTNGMLGVKSENCYKKIVYTMFLAVQKSKTSTSMSG